MSYTSGFFDAVDTGGGYYDRVYSAAAFAHYFSLLVKNGVFPDPSTGLQVKASNTPDMHVSVQPGNGWVNGYYLTVPDNGSEVLTLPTANPSLHRIDSVIMGLNYAEREIQLYIRPGAASTNPVAVSLQRDGDVYELELAQILVSAGTASISQSNITDMRSNTSRCGIVTGTVDQIDTTDLFAQYNAAFQAWFEDIQGQLSGDVAANLQLQINSLKTGKADTTVTDSLQKQVTSLDTKKVSVSDKATKEEAIAGKSTTKWMTPELVNKVTDPLFTAAIGDVYHSANNIEQQTNGKFIKLDGRVIDVQTGYPLLSDTYELKYRVAPPNRVDKGDIGWSQYYKCNGVYLNGRVFFVAEYSVSGTSYYNNLLMMTADGTVTRILAASVYGLAVCNNNVVAFTGGSSKARAIVFSATGTQLRDISLNTGTDFYDAAVYCDGTRAVVLYQYNGYIYGYYSADSFSTFGTVTFGGSTQLGGSRYLANTEYSCMFNRFQKVGSILYIGVTGDGFRLYKSTDNGASFSLVKTLTDRVSGNFFIHNGYLYLFGYYEETVNSTKHQRCILRKYSMSDFSVVGETVMLSSSALSYPTGFINGSLFYMINEGIYKMINLDTMSVTNWTIPGGIQPYLRTPFADYITNDGEYYFAYGEYLYGYPTYAEASQSIYGGVLVVHIPTGRAVYITSPFRTGTSNSNSNYYRKSKPIEDTDGNVYIATGYRTDSAFSNYSVYKFNRSERKLPSLDFAYIKAKEVTI